MQANQGLPRRRSRREFLRTSTLALAGGGLLAGAGRPVFAAHAGGGDLLRIGLVGCGGRGTGAAAEALHARRTIARARAHKEHDAYRRHDCVAVE